MASTAERSDKIFNSGLNPNERLVSTPELAILQLPSALLAEAITEEEGILATSTASHVDIFIQKWRLHLKERLLDAKESEKRFPTLHGFSFAQWASFDGPSSFEENRTDRYSRLRVLGREYYSNGKPITPSLDHIDRTLHNLGAIDEDQSISELAEQAKKKYWEAPHRTLGHTRPRVVLPFASGEEFHVDAGNITVDLLIPVTQLPILTGVPTPQ